MTPEEIRDAVGPEDIRLIVDWVRYRRCQCCGGEGDAMDCGHLRCELCEDRDHTCIACALAL